MVVADTSAVIASMGYNEQGHDQLVEFLTRYKQRLIIPMPILSEIAYVSTVRLGSDLASAIIGAAETGEIILDTQTRGVRIAELVNRYASLPLGFSDACVIACAEDHGGDVLTLDRRDFNVVAAEGTIRVLP